MVNRKKAVKIAGKYFVFFVMALSLLVSEFPVRAEGNGQTDVIEQPVSRVQNVDDGNIVIVIDPGHGGSNQGTLSGHTIEKEMTMVTAKAMFEELDKYDNVKVYLTHADDRELSLKERAEFAASVNADFLYSIHYNASENHSMFGSEVWISCKAPYDAYGYQFGYLHLLSMADKGLFIRGVKNRRNEEKTDYYGIIREAAALSVPAVIIEHCYVDAPREAEYIEDADDWAEFGRADALSVAKYFGLKSSALGVDYSGEPAKLPEATADALKSTLEDLTKPDVCVAEIREVDYETGDVALTVSAADYDSPLIYYNYSIDDGKSWTELESWPGCNTLTGEYTDTFTLKIKIPDGVRPSIQVKAYNISDIYRTSNTVRFDQAFSYAATLDSGDSSGTGDDILDGTATETDEQEKSTAVTEPVEHTHKSVGTTTFMPADSDQVVEANEEVDILTFLKISLVLAILLFVVVLISQIINYNRRKRRRWGDE